MSEDTPVPARDTSLPNPPLRTKRKADVGIFLGIIGIALAILVPVLQANGVDSVNWVWSIALYVGIAGLCIWTFLHHAAPDRSRTTRSLGSIIILLLVGTVAAYAVVKQYGRDNPPPEVKAAALTGYITAGSAPSNWKNGAVIPLEIPSKLNITSQQMRLYDASFTLDMGKEGPEISTQVLDKDGLLARIDKNHWRVYPASADKNYSSNALEVLDRRGHVVLQVALFPDHVYLQGEWRSKYGSGIRINANKMSAWNDQASEERLEEFIKPMFRYPSSEHWSELNR